MADPTKIYPLPKFHFEVDWGGTRLGFLSVSGLEVATSVIEYREGSNKNYGSTKQPGRTVYGNIILKRGVFVGDMEFFTWWQKTYFFQEQSAAFRRDITIKLLNESHVPVMVWQLSRAWPCRVKWGELNALDDQVILEELELAHEGLVLQTE